MQGKDWLQAHPEIRALHVGASDLNGIARGKRYPVRSAESLLRDGTRFPLSVLNLDIWGDDIEDSPLVLASGDQDGFLRPTSRGFVPMPWLETPTALLPLEMFHEDGTAFAGDPRHALAHIEKKFQARSLQPVIAMELEFFLIDAEGDDIKAPASPKTGKRGKGGDILSLSALDHFDAFFSDLYAGCEAMDIPADTAISESGLGQFEMNLTHQASALKGADDVWLFKMLVKGLARKHGMLASFMAKPYPNSSGNGMHMHFSVLDAQGRNAFDDGGPEGTPALRHAIAGCLQAMGASTLVFAPHANSYARLVPGAHAPTSICWAYENRTAAIRVPSGPSMARRIEHRFAGGDVNPYLSAAAILGAALNGMEDAQDPPAPISGNAYSQDLPQVPTDWHGAMQTLETSPEIQRIFPAQLIDNLLMTKRQEARRLADVSSEDQTALYLESV